MFPSDLHRTGRAVTSQVELTAARANQNAIKLLTDVVEKKKPIVVKRPSLFLDPKVAYSDPAMQGQRVEFHLQFTNNGDGTLNYILRGDCGCTIVNPPGTIAPHTTKLLAAAVDTRLFTTDMLKHVFVFTNDQTTPVQVVELHVRLKPRYRLLSPMGDSITVPSGGIKIPLYLVPSPGSDLEPLSTSFAGLQGTQVKTTFAPWQGILPDPERGEGPKQRKGYKFVLDVKGNLANGRIPGTFQIFTSDPDFPNITYNFYAQKGIIALPPDLFLGEVGQSPTTKEVLITRPSKAFTITKVESNTPLITGTVSPGTEKGDWLVAVKYMGHGKSGELLATVRVHTSDPSQPYIDIPVRATIQ
jgi:hypothetical protein